MMLIMELSAFTVSRQLKNINVFELWKLLLIKWIRILVKINNKTKPTDQIPLAFVS